MEEVGNRSKKPESSCVDIEIFAGAGGMTLGLQNAGFQFSDVFEIDSHTCETLKTNHISNGGILHGNVHKEDVSKLSWNEYKNSVRLLAGGAPCQPFSLAGRHLADKDDRNMFPEVLRAVRSLRPQAVMLENVQGLARPSFRPYLEYILRQLKWPSVAPKAGEEWQLHNERIVQHHEASCEGFEYFVNWALLEAAGYGIAQNRRRLFIIATKAGNKEKFNFPLVSHKKEALIRTQSNGEYWKKHCISAPNSGLNLTSTSNLDEFAKIKAWKTVRDAIADLPAPATCKTKSDTNHWLIPGARIYRGHSGSRLDWPAKTIKAGVHGVPGGENIVLLDDGTHRYFTLRETARLQGFPDDFVFCGARLHITRQIGNAVPVGLAEAVGRVLYKHIEKISY
ncbi:MAG: DNA cytosine methyltransferase [Gammaproteobacteria bacterium]|nr:DNA cytosine methyltransferase [Gammaproteobacteria bacterium]